MKNTMMKKENSILKQIVSWFEDPFFWNLYEAERSPDSRAMTMLYEQFTEKI